MIVTWMTVADRAHKKYIEMYGDDVTSSEFREAIRKIWEGYKHQMRSGKFRDINITFLGDFRLSPRKAKKAYWIYRKMLLRFTGSTKIEDYYAYTAYRDLHRYFEKHPRRDKYFPKGLPVFLEAAEIDSKRNEAISKQAEQP